MKLNSTPLSQHVMCHGGITTVKAASFSVSNSPPLSLSERSPNSNPQSTGKKTSSLSTTPRYPERKSPLLFLFTSRAREKDPAHLHTGCRHSHTQHTHMLLMSTREGRRVARSAEAAVSQMGHFVAYMWGIQRQQDYYTEWLHACPYILRTYTHTHTPTWCQSLVNHLFFSLKQWSLDMQHVCSRQSTTENDQLQTA